MEEELHTDLSGQAMEGVQLSEVWVMVVVMVMVMVVVELETDVLLEEGEQLAVLEDGQEDNDIEQEQELELEQA